MKRDKVVTILLQANSSVSDAEKEERKAMERKLEEMEEKLKSITSNNVTDTESELVS